MEGLKSVLDIPGILRGTISKGISDGIDEGISKNKARIERAVVKVALLLISVFFLAWGAAKIGDSISQYPGLGYLAVGAIAGLAWLILRGSES